MLARDVARVARRKGDPAFPFRDIARYLVHADIAFVNLESPFSEKGPYAESGMVFRAHPDMAQGLKLAGIDVVSTANNHARDAGPEGIEYTLRVLGEHGIEAAGTGLTAEDAHRGVVLERKGVRFGFLAYAYDQRNGNYKDDDDRIAVMDTPRMRQDVGELRKRADAVIVSMHAGVEYASKAHPIQQQFARAAIDAGAVIVCGHHPHVIQPVETYGGGVIFYSLGNLVFDQYHREATQTGLLAEVIWLGARIESFRTVPVALGRAAPRLA
jgi:poly-gamma-glutamate synthesis protein (capsule biosynthesis protein)